MPIGDHSTEFCRSLSSPTITGQPRVAFTRAVSHSWHDGCSEAAPVGACPPCLKREAMRDATMLKRHSTKIVNALLLLGSAIAVLAIAWAESRLPADDDAGPIFGLIWPDNRTYTRASPPALNAVSLAVEGLGDAGNRI